MTRAADARVRLLSLREQTEAVAVDMMTEAGRFDTIAGRGPTRAVSADNLFQTPPELAAEAAGILADWLPAGAAWLEPSAGLGRLYRAGRAAGLHGPCYLVEQSPDCGAELYRATEGDLSATLRMGDFLTMRPGRFGGVLMNPPFRRGADVRHILHALAMVEPGGLLVAFCYDGVQQRRKLMPITQTWEQLSAGSFRSEGTAAGAVLLTICAQ